MDREGRIGVGSLAEVNAQLAQITKFGLPLGKNIMRRTEQIDANYFALTNASIDVSDYIYHNGMKLSRFYGENFYGAIRTQFGGLGLTPFTLNEYYLCSFYIKSNIAGDRFFWTRSISSTSANGHGALYFNDTDVRRVFAIKKATSTSLLNSADQYWFVQAYGGLAANQDLFDAYIGGFQIEHLPNWYKQDVALIGDSTMAGSSAKKDLVGSVEVSRWAEGLLNNVWYNRAVGGEGTAAMISRWAADITPLKNDCKYCFIQGGINDLATLSTSEIVANLTTMRDLALADYMVPIVSTITPCNKAGAEETKRQEVNTLIRSTFAKVADLDLVLRSSSDPSVLDSSWIGDGVHYTADGKKVAGTYIANLSFWNLTQPARYDERF